MWHHRLVGDDVAVARPAPKGARAPSISRVMNRRKYYPTGAKCSQKGQRNVELVHNALRFVSHPNSAVKLSGKGAEQTCSKTAPGWLVDYWAT